MLKWIGALLLVASGCFGAAYTGRRAAERLMRVEGLCDLLQRIRTEVDCFSLPIGEILSRCDREILRKCGYESSSPPRDMEGLMRGCRIHDREAREILLRFSENFGRCYREEQLRRCVYACDSLRLRRERLSEELPRRRRMQSTLLVSGALALVIIFL